MDAIEIGLGLGWIYFWYVFVAILSILLLVSFGLALSRLEDGSILMLGAVALSASVIAVMIQGMSVMARLDRSEDITTESVAPVATDLSVVRSYSLTVSPSKMISLTSTFNASSILVSMTERAFLSSNGVISIGDVSFQSDSTFLVVKKGAASQGFRADVMSGQITTIMIAGAVLRITSLTALDFSTDVNKVAYNIALGNDIYLVSARGSAGSHPVDSSLRCVDIMMPWTGLTNSSAVLALLPLYNQTGDTFPIQVWGVGGR